MAPLLLVLCAGIAYAQDIQYAQSTADQNKRSSLTVDPSSLGMTVQIPLGGYAGRAGTSLPIVLQNSSKVWHMEYAGNAGLNPHANGWVSPVYAGGGGWSTGSSVPSLEVADLSKSYSISGEPDCVGCVPHTYTYVIYRIQVHMPDGSTHEVRKNDSAVLVDANHLYNSDGTYYAVDGSRLRLEYQNVINGPPTVLYLPDGSRYIWNYDSNGFYLISLVDRNGNTLTYARNQSGAYQWTDTLGRVIGLSLSATVGDTTYSLPGLGNTSVSYTLRWKRLADALTDPSQPLRYEAAYTQCDMESASSHSPNLFGTGTTCEADDFINQLFNPVLLSEVVLPNGKSYKFTYNVYGEMDKIVYPTGGYERFQYDTIPLMSYVRGYYSQANRGVVDHWISVDGSVADESAHHWHYAVSYPNNTPPYKVTMTAPDGTYTERYLYSSQNRPSFGLEDVRVGRAYDERVYSASGQMLRRTLTDWVATGPAPGGNSSASRNPRVSKSVEIVLDTGTSNALVKTTIPDYDLTYQFDVGIDQTSVAEYDWATTDQSTAQTAAISAMPLGTLVRTTQTSFLTSNANYRNRNILGLPGSTTVYKGAPSDNIVVAQSSISYDEYSLTNPGSVASWTDPQTAYRANVTTASHWLNTTNSYLATHESYDQFGNVRTATDAKGNQSQVDYSSTYQYAYPTTKTTAVPDSSGAHGSNGALSSTTNYDFNTGGMLSTTEANGVTSTLEYNDPLIRPTRTVHASGSGAQSQSPISYDDTNRVITGRSDLNLFNDSGLKVETVYDGLGRTTETRTYENDTNYIAVQTQYDAMGRAFKVSNPFRPQSETPVWTTSVFDDLGRVTSVTTPDGAVVTTSYSGNTVVVTDQGGKKRRSVTDGLGRLIRVYEPDANNNLDDQNGTPVQPTYYVYDALDNLIQVTQGGQPPRTFVYDSLKRLTAATNPESGTVSYQYDNNGNLTQKTDARGVVSTYTYDALNRNISVTYTNDPANTPAVTRRYDGWGPDANGAPMNYNIPNSQGRIWRTETSGSAGTRLTTDSFDAMGRPLTQRQQFFANGSWSDPYTVSATYDLAGHILTLRYPSDHVANYNYDQAGRLADKDAQHPAFSGTLGEGTTRTYANELQYTERGAIQQEKFGTDTPLYHKQRFNPRGQLWDMRVSTVSFNTDPSNGDRGAIVNYYSGNFIQGGSGADNDGNLLRQENYIPSGGYFQQTFAYDSLNRLSAVSEKLNGTGSDTFKQAFSYDRWGNRAIDQANTTANVPHTAFNVDPNTNRLTVPTGQSGAMIFDNAGNLTTDTYSAAAVTRAYDAENRMTSETQADSYVAGTYTYDGDGRRVKRNISGTETWQVYGLGGELIAEYAANASHLNPQKEYGYRNGQLLITAEAPRSNVALASNGATASASSYFTWGGSITCPPASAIDGEHKGLNWGYSGFWSDATGNAYPDWLEVDFAGSKTIDEIDLYTAQDNYTNPSEPTEAMTFSLYGLTGFEVQYWNGSAWADIPGGNVTGNNKVWRKFSFSPITTTKLKVVTSAGADGYSRIMELEAWGVNGGGAGGTNGYSYRRTITIDHTKVPNTDQSNFPVLVSGAYSYLATVANGGNVQNANGYDVIFTSDPGCATKLNHEVETYNAATGAVNYWVKVPTVSHTTDITVYMCYGNSSITTDQSNKTAVWDNNFVSVYHLPDGAALNVGESTSNANNGGNSGATATTGQIDGGGSFDGSSKSIDINHPSVFNFGNGDYTFEAWIKPTNNSVGGDFLSKDASGARQFCFQMATNGGAGSLNFVHFNADGTIYWRAGQNSSIATGSWAHVVAVRSGASLILYVNATSQTLSDPYSNGPLGTMAATATDALIGRRAYSGYENYFNGSIDEVRISSTARSADWIQAEYNNQNSPATFYSISAATSSAPPSSSIHWLVTDQLGTPRMIFDQNGSLANVNRHDYLPFGEELSAGTGGRTTQQGYSADGLRQKFTGYEADAETGLNFAQARCQSSLQGRFTSVDPTMESAELENPQTWNRYTYALNNPMTVTDPTGEKWAIRHNDNDTVSFQWYDGDSIPTGQGWDGKWEEYTSGWYINGEEAIRLGNMGADDYTRISKQVFEQIEPGLFDKVANADPTKLTSEQKEILYAGLVYIAPNGGGQRGWAPQVLLPLMVGALYSSLQEQQQQLSSVPQSARNTLEQVEQTGRPPSGYKGGRTFRNRENLLPKTDAQGNRITYREYDVNPYQRGVDRGGQRIVRGSDGSAYYTDTHYKSFTKVK